MKFYSTTRTHRMALVIDREGVRIEYQRPSTLGGYYVKDLQVFPWPWKKIDDGLED